MALGKNITPTQGIEYYLKDDFFLEKKDGFKFRMTWAGKLAKFLGLSGKVMTGVWEAALNGFFPNSIRVSRGFFKDEKGNRVRRAGTDFEFTAPKSVSIQALVFEDERLIEAHQHAVMAAAKELEKYIECRRLRGGEIRELTGCGLLAVVTHFVSREGDPHLHTHVIYINITMNSDGKFQAMSNEKIMHNQLLAQEIYYNELSRNLLKLGYEIGKGEYGEPQIVGVSRSTILEFSGRGKNILEYILNKWGVNWENLTPEERNHKMWMHDKAWARTRTPRRLQNIKALLMSWKSRSQELGAEKMLVAYQRRDLRGRIE